MPKRADTEMLAEVLAAHHWGDDTAQVGHHAVQCGCGWKDYEPSGDIYALRSRHDRHRAEAIAARIEQARAGETALREAARLEPAENMALTVAWHQVERGEHPMGNVAAVCVMALERIRRAALDTKGGTP